MNELLQQLTECVGVSGDEYEIRSLIRDLIVDHVDEWHVDAVGNIIACRKGTGESDLRVLVDAHIDEIGVIVTAIDSDGSLRFLNLGGINSQTLAGSVVTIGRNKTKGVIGLRPVHLLTTRRDYDKVPAQSALRIDIGAKNKAEASNRVTVGTRATFLSEYVEVGDDEDFGRTAICKALDDRAACAAIIELLRGDRYPFDLYATFTVQEESTMAGSTIAGYAVQPDVALILECTPAYDLPNDLDVGDNTALGKGPSLYLMDSRTIQDPRLVQHLIKTATDNDIPYQIRRPGGGGTNTGAIQRAAHGCSAATIGLPGRHAHTSSTMINLKDYRHYVQLADKALRTLSRDIIDRRH